MWPTIVPRTLIDDQLVRTLREVQTAAQNARSLMHDAGHYRHWADDAYRRLRPQFDDEAMGRLVRTSAFWGDRGDAVPA